MLNMKVCFVPPTPNLGILVILYQMALFQIISRSVALLEWGCKGRCKSCLKQYWWTSKSFSSRTMCTLVLYQSLLYGSFVSFLEHLYSHSSHWNFWPFSFFWWTFITFKHMYFQIFLFSIFVFTLGALMLVLSLNLNLHMVLQQGTNR